MRRNAGWSREVRQALHVGARVVTRHPIDEHRASTPEDGAYRGSKSHPQRIEDHADEGMRQRHRGRRCGRWKRHRVNVNSEDGIALFCRDHEEAS